MKIWLMRFFFRKELDELTSALDQSYADAIWFLNYGDFKKHIEWDASYIERVLSKYETPKGGSKCEPFSLS